MSHGIEYFIDEITGKDFFIFIDVGAMGGIPLKWNQLLSIMKIIAFEPDEREFNKLKGTSNITYLNCALSEKSEELRLYITEESGKSSIFRANINFLSPYEDVRRVQVIREESIPSCNVKSLDSVIEENDISDADFIKLDTQGSELLILKGGQNKVVPKIFGAQIEVEFAQMYERQPLFRDIDEFMDNNGFMLIDLRRHYWKRKNYYTYSGKGQLIFGDALYFKKIGVFYQKLSGTPDRVNAKTKIFKNILACMVYRLFDYAVDLAKTGMEQGYLTDTECKKAITEIKRYASREVPLWFRLNFRLYNMLRNFLEKFKPQSYLGWADSDQEIGNIKDI